MSQKMLRNISHYLSSIRSNSFIVIANRTCSNNRDDSNGNEQRATYYTAKDIEFCPNRAKEVSQNYVKYAEQDLCKDDPFIKTNKIEQTELQDDQEHAEAYQSFNNVSLHSVMQSNVPDPYSTSSKAPTHLNMPGSSSSQGYKYLYQKLQNTHHSKQ